MQPSRTQPVAHDARPQHLRPTMLIGIGGSGKDVLLRIRRLFYERGIFHEGKVGYPIIGYLALDTHAGGLARIEGEDEQLTHYAMEKIRFASGDAINCSVQTSEFNEYFNGGKQLYPHIFSWMLPGMRDYGASAITSGAGQNRLFGRLAFFRHHAQIRLALEARIKSIIDWATKPELREKWKPENTEVDAKQLEVVLIYSLAGGTGAGMFLDMGMLARKVVKDLQLKDMDATSFTHFAILPEPFVQAPRPEVQTVVEHRLLQRKIQENAFAALREMEYFSMRRDRTRFDLTIPPPVTEKGVERSDKSPLYLVQWDPDGEPYAVDDCPWDTCYLIGGRNDHIGQGCLVVNELYQMVAENLFLDFEPSPFGNKKRELRSNLRELQMDYMKDAVKDEKGNLLYFRHLSRRFSTFGLSKIYFDRERIRRAAGYRLAWRLVREWWLRPDPLTPADRMQRAKEDTSGSISGDNLSVTDTHFPNDPRIAFTYKVLARRITALDEGGQRTYLDQVREEAELRRQEVRSGQRDLLNSWPFKDWTEKHEGLLRETTASSGETGLAVRNFVDRTRRLQQVVDDRARCLFFFRLGKLGVRGCLGIMGEYVALSEEHKMRANRVLASQAPKAPDTWAKRLDKLQARLAVIEKRRKEALGLPFYGHRSAAWEMQRADAEKEKAGADLVKMVDGIRDYLLTLYDYRAAKEVRSCLSRIRERFAVDGAERSYRAVLQQFYAALGGGTGHGVLSFLDARFNELKNRPGEQSRTIGLLADWEALEYDRHLQKLLAPDGPDAGINWTEIERSVLERWRQLPGLDRRWKEAETLGEVVLTLIDFQKPEPMSEERLRKFAQTLAEACEELLPEFARDLTALKQFEKENADNRSNRLYQLRTYSAPYLRISPIVDQASLDTDPHMCLGLAHKESDEGRRFIQDLEHSAERSYNYFDMKDDAIVLYQEKAGIPICYEAAIDALGELYDTSERQPERHIDYDGLKDRLPEVRRVDQGRQKQLAICLEHTLYGAMTGILDYKDPQKGFHLALPQAGGRALFRSVGASIEEVARHCAGHSNQEKQLALQTQVTAWVDEASRNPERLALLWCAIQFMYDEIVHRVQALLDVMDNEAPGTHPLIYILGGRMLPSIENKLAGLDAGQGKRTSTSVK